MKTKKVSIQPLVSVIVPNFNYGRYLETCINSILNQDYEWIEVVVVDDGSTDESLDVISSLANRVRLLRQENQGVNSARNLGIVNAKGSLIALCDSDDFWEPKKIQTQVLLLMQDPSLVLVGSAIRYFEDSGQESKTVEVIKQGSLFKSYKRRPGVAWIPNAPSSSIFYKADALSVGLFDESLRGNAEDWEFFARLSSRGNFRSINEPLVNVRLHSSSRSRVDIPKWYRDNRKALSVLHSKGLFNGKFEFLLGRTNLDYAMLKAQFRNFRLRELLICMKIFLSRV